MLARLTGIPILGFLIGLISHAILDSIEPQEYSINAFKPDKDILFIEFILSSLLICLAWGNTLILYSILGGILPDIIDGFLSLIDKSRYMSGNHLFWFHKANSNIKEMSKEKTIIISIILFIVTLI